MFDRKDFIHQPVIIEKELRLLFPGGSCKVILDIGACEAEDSIRYSRLFPFADIFSFEPLPQNIAIARKNLDAYAVKQVRLFNKAMADKEGIAEFFVSSGRPPGMPETDWDFGNKSSSLLAPDLAATMSGFLAFDKTIPVETTTIDHFCATQGIEAIDFIHLDVQGAELMVLSGAKMYLHLIKAIWLEVSTVSLYKEQALAGEVASFMRQHGFVLVRDCLYGTSGDRLYIAEKFFPHHRKLFPLWTRRKTLLRTGLRRLGLR